MKAIWNDKVLAESDETVIVEGNYYFPPDAIDKRYFKDSSMHTVCPWKGTASYYDIVVGDHLRVRQRRGRAKYSPGDKGQYGNANHAGNEPACDFVRIFLDVCVCSVRQIQ